MSDFELREYRRDDVPALSALWTECFGDGPGSISCPVESAALALWAARTPRRDPKRKQRAW